MKIACIQPKVFNNRKKCYNEIEEILTNLLKEVDCDIACLPERWSPFLKSGPQNLQKERGDDYNFIKNLAKNYQTNLLSGGIWEKRENTKKPSITCYYFNDNGEEIGRQDKIHLYSAEREIFEPGKVLNLFSLNNYTFAILICFDMAFFETPSLATENGADLLLSPTSIKESGMSNWKIYLQARVLENRIPALSCNTYGTVNGTTFLGNSKILSFVKGFISPSKLRLIEGPIGSEGFVYDEIDLKFPQKLRRLRLNERVDRNKINVKIINK